MSRAVTKRAGGLPLYEAKLRRQGKRVPPKTCRECGAKCGGRRRSWCSDTCVDAYRLRTDPAWQRRAVLLRDHGVCSTCGRDCVELEAVLRPLREVPYSSVLAFLSEQGRDPSAYWPSYLPAVATVRAAVRVYLELGIGLDRNGNATHLHRRTWWDMDHRKPLSEGGTNDLANLRTLCVPCHLQESARGAARRATRTRLLEEASRRPAVEKTTGQLQLWG